MKILLTAINAKYIHSNLAVYSLKASAGIYEDQVELAEYTINHQMDEIFAGIYRRKPELLLMSCYIWNRREPQVVFVLHRIIGHMELPFQN